MSLSMSCHCLRLHPRDRRLQAPPCWGLPTGSLQASQLKRNPGLFPAAFRSRRKTCEHAAVAPGGQGAKLLHNASPSAPASHQAAFSTRLRPKDRAQGRGANAGAKGQFPLIRSFLFTGTCSLCLFCLLQGLSRHMLLSKLPP